MQNKTKWWLEPSTWQQHDAIAKHYKMSKQEAALVYPTKGEAAAAIKASFFKACLQHCISDALAGRLKEFSQLREYFVDDSEGGQDNLGNRDLKSIWEYVKIYVRK